MRHYFVFYDSYALCVSERVLSEYKLSPYQQITAAQAAAVIYFMKAEMQMLAVLQNVQELVKRVTHDRLKFCRLYLMMGRLDKHLTECVLDPYRLRH